MLFVAAAGTIIGIIRLALLGRLRTAGGLLANALGLLVGLQLVRWLLDLLQAIAALGADSDYLLAGLFFLTVLWGFASSGDKLTGTKANSAKYPRDGRILLTVSYTLVSSATLLYLGALHGPARDPAPPSYLTGDPFTPLGLARAGLRPSHRGVRHKADAGAAAGPPPRRPGRKAGPPGWPSASGPGPGPVGPRCPVRHRGDRGGSDRGVSP